jgi:histone-lysine N-methyltransferase SUV420H
MWPKTDSDGIYDSEKRILDHRTIHRFIRPAEEKIVRRRDKSSTASRAMTMEVNEVVPDENAVPKRRGWRRKATPG